MFLPKTKGPYGSSDRVQFETFFSNGMPFADGSNPSFNLFFSLEDGPMFDPCKIPGSRSLHDRKLATWALLVGEPVPRLPMPKCAAGRIAACCRMSTSRVLSPLLAGRRWCVGSSGCCDLVR